MGKQLRALILVVALLAVGVLAGSALSQWWEVPGSEGAASAVSVVVHPRERVRVEVLNAGGRQGMAKSATDALRDDGFDVVYFGNARPSFAKDSSIVLDRVGRIDLAQAVADALGIRTVVSQPDSNLYLDVSVVIGEGWDMPVPDTTTASRTVPRPWWDPRRYLRREPPPASGGEGTMADPGRQGDR